MKLRFNLQPIVQILRGKNRGMIPMVRTLGAYLTTLSCAQSQYTVAVDHDDRIVQGWTPVPLRLWFWLPLVTFMILLAIGLEIALHYSNKQKGRYHMPLYDISLIN
jgi:hypothetical protein